MIVILLILEIWLTLISFLLTNKNFSSSSVLVNLSFLFSTVLLCAYIPKWDLTISFQTCMLIFAGNVLLFIGELITIIRRRPVSCNYEVGVRKAPQKNFAFSVPNKITAVILLFELISIVLVYHYIATHVTIVYSYTGEARTLLGSYRSQQSEVHAAWVTGLLTIGKILMYFYTFLVLHGLICAHGKVCISEIFVLVESVVLCSLSSSRIDIILLAGTAVVWIYGMLKHQYNNVDSVAIKMIKSLFIVLILMFFLFFALGTLTGKTGSTISALMDTVVVYAGGGTIGLDQYLKTFHGSEFAKSSETLYGLSSILTKLSIPAICKYRNLEFFFLGNSKNITGNTYTVFRRLLHDYGYLGTFLIRILEGIFFGELTQKIYYAKNDYKYFERLLLNGTLTGVLITEAVDTHFLMTLPTITELLMLAILWLLYRFATTIEIRYKRPFKFLIKRKNISA